MKGHSDAAATIAEAEKKPFEEMTDDEKIDSVAAKILQEHKAAFEALAKG